MMVMKKEFEILKYYLNDIDMIIEQSLFYNCKFILDMKWKLLWLIYLFDLDIIFCFREFEVFVDECVYR